MEIEILKDGKIRFCRCSKENNEILLSLFKDLNIDNVEQVEEFLNESKNIENIFGKDIFCG